jgi:transcriptional regulator with XRE-family HTH domain
MNNTIVIQKGTFADNVRKLRVSGQLSQKELAILAGVNREDVEKIENGIPLQLETRLKILRVLYDKAHPRQA